MGTLSMIRHQSFKQVNGLSRLARACALLAISALTGCDQLGIDTPAKVEERLVAESKAIGSACRHAMRAIEDCYAMNPKAQKAAIADGWREMDEYMRENKLEGVTPTIAKAVPGRSAKDPDDEEEDHADEDPKVTESDSTRQAKTEEKSASAPAAEKAGADSGSKDQAGKSEQRERGAGSKNKRDTLHAEASASQPH